MEWNSSSPITLINVLIFGVEAIFGAKSFRLLGGVFEVKLSYGCSAAVSFLETVQVQYCTVKLLKVNKKHL